MSTIYNSDRNKDGFDSLAIWNDLMRDNGVAAGDPFGFSFDTLNIDKTENSACEQSICAATR